MSQLLQCSVRSDLGNAVGQQVTRTSPGADQLG
jgi:hypothetical protein